MFVIQRVLEADGKLTLMDQNEIITPNPFFRLFATANTVGLGDTTGLYHGTQQINQAQMDRDSIRLPQISRRMTREEVMLARGTADAFALRHKFHDVKTAAKYMPQGQMAKDLYDAMETARIEAVGAKHMPGTAGNIDAKISNDALRKGYDGITDTANAPLATAAGYLIRHLATGRALPKGAQNVMDLWRGFIEDHAGDGLDNIADLLDDQQAFAKFARQMIADLGYGDQLGDDPDGLDDDEDTEAETGDDDEQDQPDSTCVPIWINSLNR